MAHPILRPLALGEILDGAFTLYRRNFATFIVTALIPTLAIALGFVMLGGGYVAAMTSSDPSAMFAEMMGGLGLMMLVGMIATLVMWPALTREAAQAYTGQPTSVPDGFRAGARAVLPLLGALLLGGLGLMLAGIGVVIVLSLVMLVFSALGAVVGIVGMVLVVLGYFAFFFAAFAVLFAVVPAIVVEGAGPIEALERSFTLARSALGRVAGVMTVAMLISYLPMMAVMALTGGLAQMMNPEKVPTAGQFITQQLLGTGVGILTTPFLASVIVLLYFDRRVRTEALDVQMMTDSLAVAGD
ncbi:MAG TPA: hypothetical protein VFT45_20785 [Longimicrobium sp.]|nr:hypothetical protein [Longimicrobium sp.]